jgi:hypothetical protein
VTTHLECTLPDAVTEILHVGIGHDTTCEVADTTLKTGEGLVVAKKLIPTTVSTLFLLLRPAEVSVR